MREPSARIVRGEADPVCDFCSAQPIARVFKAGDIETMEFPREVAETVQQEDARFQIEGLAAIPAVAGQILTLTSIGGWAACAACTCLIDQGDPTALARRTVRVLAEQYPDMRPLAIRRVMEAECLRLQRAFWRARPVWEKEHAFSGDLAGQPLADRADGAGRLCRSHGDPVPPDTSPGRQPRRA